MIKDVEVIYHEEIIDQNGRTVFGPVWARGKMYGAVDDVKEVLGLKEGRTLFKKSYPKDTPTVVVWKDIRDNMGDYFIDIFYPAIVEQTATLYNPPEPGAPYVSVVDPDGKTRWITEHISKKSQKQTNFYHWNVKDKRFVMKPQAYKYQVETAGGGLNIGISESSGGGMEKGGAAVRFLDILQSQNHGKTIQVFLFVYPDSYDQEVRAMFELRITFW